MSAKPKAFLLHGFLGAGKTTFAMQLEKEQRALRFTHDAWMSSLYGDDPPAARFDEQAARVSGVIEGMWTRCLEIGVNVILDSGFWSRAERERTRRLVASHGGEAILFRLACPEEVALRRIAQRNQRLAGSLHISPGTFAALKERFEPLGEDEDCVEIPSL